MKTHALTGLQSLLEESREALQKRIRVRAYHLYEQRGREYGLTHGQRVPLPLTTSRIRAFAVGPTTTLPRFSLHC